MSKFENSQVVEQNARPIIAITMATGLQGKGVVKSLSEKGCFKIRAITRDPSSKNAEELAKLANVDVIKGDLLNTESLLTCFEGAYGIFGNTTPTKGRQPLVREYEMEQGKNLIDVVKTISKKGCLKHFVFSSICKAQNPIKNEPAPGHFTSKWDIEDYLKIKKLNEITTIIRPASYFENFNFDLPGLSASNDTLRGVVKADKKWQIIAVRDIGRWSAAIFCNPKRFINQNINLAGEELTPNEMVNILKKSSGKSTAEFNYFMIPRLFMKIFVNDIGIMADWIERAGYGANLTELKEIAKEENIDMTTLESWFRENYI